MQNFSHPLFYIVIFLITSFMSAAVSADDRPGGKNDLEHPIQVDLIPFEGMVIESIEIENRRIFDTSKEPYDNFIFKTANKLHVTTRKSVLARELLLKEGDEFSVELALETARNLRNRYTIYDAWIEPVKTSDSTISIRIVTIDEWSFAGGIEISREGNEYRYELSFEERNFLGLNQFVSLDYIIQEKDENYIESTFKDIRFLSWPVSFSVAYSGNPESEIKILSMSHPFYSLSQKYSYGFYMGKSNQRNEVFNNSELIGRSHTKSDLFGLNLSYRYGKRRKNLVSQLSYDYNFERVEDKTVFSTDPQDSLLAFSTFPRDSLYNLVGIQLRGNLLNFTTFRKVDGFGYTEDFVLGQTVAIGYARAFDPEFDDHSYDKLTFDFCFGRNFENELFYLSYINTNKFKGGRDFQRTSVFLGNYYHRGPEFLTIAFRALFERDWRREGTQSLILGGSTGIRGYPQEFKTGDRLATLNLETRFHPDIKILSTVMGVAAFLDAGRTYKPGQQVTLNDLYFSGGVGLRFTLDRSSKSRFFRIDLAYSEYSKWQLSLNTGQYFSYSVHRLFLTSR